MAVGEKAEQSLGTEEGRGSLHQRVSEGSEAGRMIRASSPVCRAVGDHGSSWRWGLGAT